MTTASVAAAKPEVPPQANNSYRFSLFNAVNFQITLGAPMVLYTKALGGSATTIGIVAGGLFSIANTRIAMDTMPEMGRNHFFPSAPACRKEG